MAKISFKERTGKDLFDFLQAVSVDPKTAKIWALENFVLINDKPITIENISKLKNDVYIVLTEKVFSVVNNMISENNTGIEYKNFHIKRKLISRDIITELQAMSQNNKNDHTTLAKNFIVKFFDTTLSEMEVMPYEIVGYMFQQCNEFFDKITKFENEFYLDELYTTDTEESINGGVVDVV